MKRRRLLDGKKKNQTYLQKRWLKGENIITTWILFKTLPLQMSKQNVRTNFEGCNWPQKNVKVLLKDPHPTFVVPIGRGEPQ